MRMWSAAVVLSCAGCGIAFDAQDGAGGASASAVQTSVATTTTAGGAPNTSTGGSNGGEGGSGGAPPSPCHPAGLVDTFDTLDGSLWNTQGASITSVYGGALHIDPLAEQNDGQWSGLVTAARYDLRACSVWIEAPTVVHTKPEGFTYWQLHHADGTVGVTVRQNDLELHIFGSTDFVTPYDPVAHRWWRIREEASTTHLETSPDGIAWVGRHSGASPAFIGDVAIGLGRVSATDVPSPGETVLDNLDVSP